MNINKSQSMIISGNQRLNKLGSITIATNGENLEDVNPVRHLGAVIKKNQLSWQNHIGYISDKISKKLGLLVRLKYLACLQRLELCVF